MCRVVSPLVNDGAAVTIYITSSSNGALQIGAVEAIIENGGVLRRGIQLQVKLLRNQNRDALRDQTLVKANDR